MGLPGSEMGRARRARPERGSGLGREANLAASAWFTILASSLSWIMPGVNALLARRTRPDLVQDAPYIRWLPYLGAVWLVFTLVLYWFAASRRSTTRSQAAPMPSRT